MFGSQLGLPGRSNVLTAPEFHGKKFAMLAYFTTTLSVAFSYPISTQSIRDALENVLLNFGALTNINKDVRRNGLSALVAAVNLAVALSTSDLGIMNSATGAIACLLIFVFPSLMYLKLTGL